MRLDVLSERTPRRAGTAAACLAARSGNGRSFYCGTDGSNPVPSAGESNANLTSAGAPRIVRGANLESKLSDVLLPSVCRAGSSREGPKVCGLSAGGTGFELSVPARMAAVLGPSYLFCLPETVRVLPNRLVRVKTRRFESESLRRRVRVNFQEGSRVWTGNECFWRSGSRPAVPNQRGDGFTPQSGSPDGSAFQNMILSK
jgi:hypothetical protein